MNSHLSRNTFAKERKAHHPHLAALAEELRQELVKLYKGRDDFSPENRFPYLINKYPQYLQPALRHPHPDPAKTPLVETLRLDKHTDKVLEQFKKHFETYFDQRFENKVTRFFFTLLLLIHDIGKPQALANGDKSVHHDLNKIFISNILPTLKYSPSQQALLTRLTCMNPLGKFFRNEKSLIYTLYLIQIGYRAYEKSKKESEQHTCTDSIDPLDYFELMKIYFMCDASAYTSDAYPEGSPFATLNHLFDFSDGIQFASPYQEKFHKLEEQYRQHREANQQDKK